MIPESGAADSLLATFPRAETEATLVGMSADLMSRSRSRSSARKESCSDDNASATEESIRGATETTK
jgi:hypothetical protein